MFCKRCKKHHDCKRKTCDDCLVKIKIYKQSHPEKVAEQSKRWYQKETSREILAKVRIKYLDKLKSLGITPKQRCVTRNPEKVKEDRKKSTAKAIENLADRYVKAVIILSLPERISSKLIPQELIETTRASIKLKRLLKEMNK